MNLDPKNVLTSIAKATAGVGDIASGNIIGGIGKFLDVALEFLPVDELRQHLDAAAIRRQNAAADAIEDVRFGAKSP